MPLTRFRWANTKSSRAAAEMAPHRTGQSATEQRGSTIPLIVAFTVILLLAGVTVVDTTAAWIHRQSLNNAAEGAALYAADQAAQGRDVYTQGLTSDLRLDVAVARRAVRSYLARAEIKEKFPSVRAQIRVVDNSVQVRLRARLKLPMVLPGGPSAPWVSGHGAARSQLDPR